MINVRTIRKLKDNDGLTLKDGKIITYKTGWQVADYGCEFYTAEAAAAYVRKLKGNCGVWYANQIYYVDHSFRIKLKKEALVVGKKYNQISIFGWKTQKLAYC